MVKENTFSRRNTALEFYNGMLSLSWCALPFQMHAEIYLFPFSWTLRLCSCIDNTV